jgi:UDP-N-acetylmuramate--alanine ligase
MTYDLADRGAHQDVAVTGYGVLLEAFGSRCTVRYRAAGQPDELLGELRLRVPGRHNLLNALAATTVGLEVGLRFDRIARASRSFAARSAAFRCVVKPAA